MNSKQKSMATKIRRGVWSLMSVVDMRIFGVYHDLRSYEVSIALEGSNDRNGDLPVEGRRERGWWNAE